MGGVSAWVDASAANASSVAQAHAVVARTVLPPATSTAAIGASITASAMATPTGASHDKPSASSAPLPAPARSAPYSSGMASPWRANASPKQVAAKKNGTARHR
jgi:hypothetical protein